MLYVHQVMSIFFIVTDGIKLDKTHWTYCSIMLKSLNQPTEFSFLILITNSSEAQFLSIQKILVINDKMLRYLLVFLIWLGLGQVGLDVGQRLSLYMDGSAKFYITIVDLSFSPYTQIGQCNVKKNYFKDFQDFKVYTLSL